MDLVEKITDVWMEGFWYGRPVDYKAEWDKLYQAIKSGEATASLDDESDNVDEDEDEEG